jgi:hypothetical protein
MSQLSPGSKNTTNVFMVLGGLALAALVIVQNMSAEQTAEDWAVPVDCATRIIEISAAPELISEGSHTSVTFMLLADGAIKDIEVTADRTEAVPLVIEALSGARFSAADDGRQIWCEYQFR